MQMKLDKKNLSIAVGCYVLWGILPAYWNLLSGVNSLFILCCRIVFAFIFMMCILAVTGRMSIFLNTLKDKRAMRHLIPSSMFITCNWGIYIWAVNSGRVLDSSLGYYINPLIAFLLGVLLFREKHTKLQLAAVGLAFAGVIISLVAFGSFPYVALALSLSFATYGVLKRKARTDPVAGIAVESMIFTPFALVFAFVFLPNSFETIDFYKLILLIGGGALTAIPLVLYSRAVNSIPFIVVGFLQYISPSLALIYGLISGEIPSAAQLVSFTFIGLGLVLFSVAMVRIAKKEKADNK